MLKLEIPGDWKGLKLKDSKIVIIDGDRGKNYPKMDDFFSEGYCLFLNTGNIKDNRFNFKECMFITKERDELLRKGKLTRDDIVLTTRGTVGNIAHFHNKIPFDHVRLNSGMVILRNKSKLISTDYLYYLLTSELIQRQFQRISSGSAQPQLPIKDMKHTQIVFPPYNKQENIVSILSNVDAIIQQTQQLIEHLQLLKQGLMQRLFTEGIGHTEFQETRLGRIPKEWEIIKLSKICKIIMGQSPPSSTYNDQEDGIPFFQGNADFGIKYPSVRIWCNSPKKFAEINDILISVRAPVGAINLSNIRCSIGRGLASIRIDNENLREYIFNYLTYFKRDFNRLKQGSTFEAINKSDLTNLKIKKPTEDSEIKMISQILSNLNNTVFNEINYLEKVKEIKKGLMQQLLTGKKRMPIT